MKTKSLGNSDLTISPSAWVHGRLAVIGNIKRVERLRAVGQRHGRSPGEVAIAWTLRHPAVTGAIVGARNAKQADGIIGGMDFRLTPEEIVEVEGG